MKMYKWIVEFQVSENRVEEGFDLTDVRAKEMIENDLPYSLGFETKAKVLKAPPKKVIQKVQGY